MQTNFLEGRAGYVFLKGCVSVTFIYIPFTDNTNSQIYKVKQFVKPIKPLKKFENHCTRASLHSDTVENLIRISGEGPSVEDFDARESVASWFSQGQRSGMLNYRSWPSEGHVTAMEDNP